ncbi:hypothetical protein BRARA_H01617 [Brassica rapa]|uniref:Histidine kinase/HSP90-like ATPase domain-containing protein n=1 Tax=Brassica campestris TaxID=3711 RepID=A0A397YBT2_BRACM|nr:hypothetical protein BRARA_H01617 [Brassica rapa]
MRKKTIVSVMFLFSLLFLLPEQGRKLHANAEESSNDVTDPPKVEEKLGGHGGLSTDSDVVHRESESISKKSLRSSAEKFEFQAEVSRLMDIIINSLYSNKDIFLRELISNASDALDKIRFLALTDKDVLGEGDTAKLEIQIKLDKAKKILSIRDRGIGMRKEDLIKNLGTIAKSGTSAFVEKMQSSGDLNLIGQFGVGFYSAYLVADYIEVISKHNDDIQHVWESKADGKFAVSEDTWNEPLGRGTEIRLHLRDEAGEYLEESKLKDLVKRYSEFINFPIHLWASKETIKKKLIRKALDMIRKLAEEDPDEVHDDDKKDMEKSGENDEKKGQYTKFWKDFGKSIKLGIIEDASNRNRLAKLLRFETTKSDGKLTSLDQYIKRMKKGQKDVFYIIGSSKQQLEKSPFLERLIKKGYEVIFFTDPVDEYLMQYLMDYEDKKFQNVSKEGLKVGKDSKVKELKEAFKELTKWWKESLAGENVDDVKISNRLADTPCIVVTSKFGWSANMERIMQSQTLSDAKKQAYMRGKRVLEINPRHPIIKELKDRVASHPEDKSVKETAQLMYQTALIESGFILNDPKDFAGRIYNSVKSSLKISPDAVAEEEVEADETETSEEATETKSDGGLNIEAEPVEKETPTKDEL